MPATKNNGYHHLLIVLSLFMLGLSLHYALSLRYGVPIPTIHDEMAYHVAADTFAQGRLTNPVHPLWEHFQTFHVFFQPSYQTKYPPLQGMFMAFGQVAFGAPIWGVWISMALAYCAVYWMFISAVRPLYALLGTLIVMIHPLLTIHWGHTYWGGGVALLGGALYFGGIRHSAKTIRFGNSLLLASGIFILANSRPFEGFMVCLISIPMLIKIIIDGVKEEGGRKTTRQFIAPVSVACIVTLAWILSYNAALTGDPLKFYYLNWSADSATVDMIRSYSGSPPLPYLSKLKRYWGFFVGPFLSLALVGVVVMLSRKKLIFESLAVVIMVAVSVFYSRAWPHYLAPVACLIYLLIFLGFYEITQLELFRNKRVADGIFALILIVHFVLASLGTYAIFEKGPARPFIGKLRVRQEIIHKLKGEPGKDLMIVSYGPEHNSHEEWVYNRADIDNADIVWARDLGQEKNQRLLSYFKDRTVWVLYPDRKPIGLMMLSEATPKYDTK